MDNIETILTSDTMMAEDKVSDSLNDYKLEIRGKY